MAPRHFFFRILDVPVYEWLSAGKPWNLLVFITKLWQMDDFIPEDITVFFCPFYSIQRLRATGDAIKQHLKGVILCHILVQCLLPPQASVTEAICSQIAKGISWGFHKGCKVMESTLADCLLVSPEIIYCTGQYGKIKGWKTGEKPEQVFCLVSCYWPKSNVGQAIQENVKKTQQH